MPTEKIKIIKLGRKQQPSKYQEGQTYSITSILDQKGRKISGIGKWTDGWNVGDIVEGNIEERKWTDRDGFEQVSLTLRDPNAQKWSGRSGAQSNPIIISYQLAAAFAPFLFAGKKGVTLEEIDKLAEELKKRIDIAPTQETKAEVKEDKTPELDLTEDTDSAGAADESADDEPF